MDAPSSLPRWLERHWPWSLVIAAMLAWGLVNLQWGRGIGWDEVEFLKATDWVRKGQVPYRDFFEHHSPLMWFLMAPFEGLVRGPGVAPGLWMRWVQVPLWGGALWRLQSWSREDGRSRWSRALALGCLLGTPFFVFSALEYRVDTLGTLLVILALDRLRRPGSVRAGLAGFFLAAAVTANLRFAPLALATALVAPFLDLGVRAWRFQPRKLVALALGAAAGFLPWLLYLTATHSAGDMWRWCFTANAEANAAIPAARSLGTYLLFPLINMDLPGLLLEAGVVCGAWFALKEIRRPGFTQLLLLVHAANLAFIAAMKIQYLYHFELTFCLAAPLLSSALDQLAEQRPSWSRGLVWSGFGALLAGMLINFGTLAYGNDHPTLAYQDRTLKEAAKLAPEGSVVLDGCGWMLDAKPAYAFWFLPLLARVLYLQHRAPAYSPGAFRQNPPALVIPSARVRNLAMETPGMGEILTTHYLPVESSLWVPGLSRVLSAEAPEWTWIVPAEGDYRLLCSPSLAGHPWFRDPFGVTTTPIPALRWTLGIDPAQFPSEGAERLQWRLDGQKAVPASGAFHLAKGQTLQVELTGQDPIGVMLVRKGTGRIFSPPPPNVTLDYITFDSYWPHA